MFDVLESFCVSKDVAVSGDELAYLTGDGVVAMALSDAYVHAIDVDAQRRFDGDVVDSVYARVTEDRQVPFLVDPLAGMFYPGDFRV